MQEMKDSSTPTNGTKQSGKDVLIDSEKKELSAQEKNQMLNYIDLLPDEIVLKILNQLHLKDLIAVHGTNQRLRYLSTKLIFKRRGRSACEIQEKLMKEGIINPALFEDTSLNKKEREQWDILLKICSEDPKGSALHKLLCEIMRAVLLNQKEAITKALAPIYLNLAIVKNSHDAGTQFELLVQLGPTLSYMPDTLNQVVKSLKAFLANKNNNDVLRYIALKTLGQLGPALSNTPDTLKEVVDTLIAYQKDTNPRDSTEACEALGRLAPALSSEPAILKQVVDILIARIEDKSNTYIRIASCKALGYLGPALSKAPDTLKKVVNLLLACLKENNYRVPDEACKALGQLGAFLSKFPDALNQVIDSMITLLKKDNCYRYLGFSIGITLGQLVSALSNVPDRHNQIVTPLISLINKDDRYIRINAFKALGQLGATLSNSSDILNQLVDSLIERLNNSKASYHSDYEMGTCWALSMLAPALSNTPDILKKAVDSLIAYLRNKVLVSMAAFNALTKLASVSPNTPNVYKMAVTSLIAWLEDKNTVIQIRINVLNVLIQLAPSFSNTPDILEKVIDLLIEQLMSVESFASINACKKLVQFDSVLLKKPDIRKKVIDLLIARKNNYFNVREEVSKTLDKLGVELSKRPKTFAEKLMLEVIRSLEDLIENEKDPDNELDTNENGLSESASQNKSTLQNKENVPKNPSQVVVSRGNANPARTRATLFTHAQQQTQGSIHTSVIRNSLDPNL